MSSLDADVATSPARPAAETHGWDWDRVDRAALARAKTELLARGKWSKADVHLVELDGRRAVLKDYAVRRTWLIRLYGRLQTGREARAYRQLDGVAGVPRLLARVDAHAILIDPVPGERITRHRFEERAPLLFAQLDRLVRRIHERGVVHGDLRARDNVLVDPRGEVFVIDFASAQVFPAGTWRRRWLFPRLRTLDDNALLKYKRLLAPDALTESERRQERLIGRLGLLWLINPKAWIEWWKRRLRKPGGRPRP